jgi:hypothetical protein
LKVGASYFDYVIFAQVKGYNENSFPLGDIQLPWWGRFRAHIYTLDQLQLINDSLLRMRENGYGQMMKWQVGFLKPESKPIVAIKVVANISNMDPGGVLCSFHLFKRNENGLLEDRELPVKNFWTSGGDDVNADCETILEAYNRKSNQKITADWISE